MIAEARGYAHRWIGETELLVGARRVARKHLAAAFRLGQRRAWTLALLCASFAPRWLITRMAGLRRRFRGRAGR
jgi:predicted deacetylase